MNFEQIEVISGNGVATIRLNRPERLNAWTQQMEREVRMALMAASEDTSIRAAIITGAGRAFCAGADMDELKVAASQASGLRKFVSFPREHPPGVDANFDYRFSYIWRLRIPVIAAINGPVAGIGLCLALFCDYRFIAASAPLVTAFAQRGLIAEHGCAWLLPRLVGHAEALRLLLSSDAVTADYADQIGLARKVDDVDLAATSERYASELANRLSPRSAKIIKRQVYESLFQDFATSADFAEEEMFESFGSEDFREGIAHFVEKRAPQFTGR